MIDSNESSIITLQLISLSFSIGSLKDDDYFLLVRLFCHSHPAGCNNKIDPWTHHDKQSKATGIEKSHLVHIHINDKVVRCFPPNHFAHDQLQPHSCTNTVPLPFVCSKKMQSKFPASQRARWWWCNEPCHVKIKISMVLTCCKKILLQLFTAVSTLVGQVDGVNGDNDM